MKILYFLFLLTIPIQSYTQTIKLLDFTISECKKNCLVKAGVIEDSIINNIYNIKIGANLSCCANYNGTIEYYNDTLNLKTILSDSTNTCFCYCYYELTYKVKNMYQKPKVILINKNTFEKNQLISGKNKVYFDYYANICEDNIFMRPEIKPMPTNKLDSLINYLNNDPQIPKNLSGTILIRFVVNCKGEAVNFEIFKSDLDKIVSNRIIELFSNEHIYTPGKQDNREIDSYMILPVIIKDGIVKIGIK